MKIETSYDKVSYEQTVKKAFEDLLNKGILNIDPYIYNDTDIFNYIQDNSHICSYTDHWGFDLYGKYLFIEKIISRQYMGHDFKVIHFKSEDGTKDFECKFNEFIYDANPPYKGEIKNINVCSTINKNQVNPNIFEYLIGSRIFYMYSFPTINSFGKEQKCARFMMPKENRGLSGSDLRQFIIEIQWFILKYILINTDTAVIPTSFKIKNPSGTQYYIHNTIDENLKHHFDKIFNENFKDMYQKLLLKTEQTIISNNIKCYDRYWME